MLKQQSGDLGKIKEKKKIVCSAVLEKLCNEETINYAIFLDELHYANVVAIFTQLSPAAPFMLQAVTLK